MASCRVTGSSVLIPHGTGSAERPGGRRLCAVWAAPLGTELLSAAFVRLSRAPSFREIRTPANVVRCLRTNGLEPLHPRPPGFRRQEAGAGSCSSGVNNGCPMQNAAALKPFIEEQRTSAPTSAQHFSSKQFLTTKLIPAGVRVLIVLQSAHRSSIEFLTCAGPLF